MVYISDLHPINAYGFKPEATKTQKESMSHKFKYDQISARTKPSNITHLETFVISGISPLVRFKICKGLKFLPCNFASPPIMEDYIFHPPLSSDLNIPYYFN